MKSQKVCIVDDDAKIVFAIQMILENQGYDILCCSNGKECLDAIKSNNLDVIFLDIAMPDISGLQILEEIKNRGLNIPVIIMTGFGTLDTAIKAIQLGAFEYLTKPLDMQKIRLLAQRALEIRRMREQISDLKLELTKQQENEEFVVGRSPLMNDVFKKIGAITGTSGNGSVLIEGESGTGKELVSIAIHKNSLNKDQPFVVINCTTIPENMLESQLFGHERGAFTGAYERRIGKMEIAKKGTIFFDEIGDLSLGLQQKLLRVLQEREFERLGSHEIHKVEARFIFATNHDLNADIKNGRFREDLFFRINVMPIKLPPLRDRKEDIPIFVNYFIGRFNRILGKAVTVLPAEVMSLFMEYDFPGNVRELSNLIERGLILSHSNIFNFESLSEVIPGNKGFPEVDFHITNFNFRESRRHMLDEFEKKFLTELLKINKGRVSLAAKRMGLERQSLYRLLKKHGINLSQFNHKSHILGDNL